MKRYSTLFSVVALIVCLVFAVGCGKKQEPAPGTPAAAPSLNMQDGQWEITVTTDMPGMPAAAMKPHTFTTCLTKKEPVAQDKAQSDCKVEGTKIEGNTVTWSVTCKDATSKGTVTYAGTSFDGKTDTTVKQGGKEMTIKTTMKGKHMGACPAK